MSWYSDYLYRAKIPCSRASGAESNYQMRIQLVKGSGVNSAGVIYLNNRCLNWPNDIRFAKLMEFLYLIIIEKNMMLLMVRGG